MSLIKVDYNGIEISAPVSVIPTRWAPVMSASGRNIRSVQMTLMVSGYIYNTQIQQKGTTWQNICATLTSQGGTFNYTENGQNIIQAAPANATLSSVSTGVQYFDCDYGPKGAITMVQNNPFGYQIMFELSVTISPSNSFLAQQYQDMTPLLVTQNQAITSAGFILPASSIGSGLMDVVMEAKYQIDVKGYETRSIDGELVLQASAGTWDDVSGSPSDIDSWRFAAVNLNRFLGISFLNPPPYYERAFQEFRVLPDRRTLRFTIVDSQLDWVPPFPCTYYDAAVITQDDASVQLGSLSKTVAVAFTLPPATAQIGNGAAGMASSVYNAVQDAGNAAMAVIMQSLQNFVLTSDNNVGSAIFIHDFEMERSSVRRNLYKASWKAKLTRSALYTSGGLNAIGIFAAPPNTAPGYASPGPYGFDGLRGSGYSPGQDKNLGLYINAGNFGQSPNANLNAIMAAQADSEGNLLHEELAHVEYLSSLAFFPAGTKSTVGQTTFNGFPIVIVSGYKGKVCNPSAGTNMTTPDAPSQSAYPRPVTPASVFTVVTNFGTKKNSTPSKSPLVQAVNSTQAPPEVMVLHQSVTNRKAYPSKLNGTWFLVTEYAFIVAVNPLTKINVSGSTIPSIFPGNYNWNGSAVNTQASTAPSSKPGESSPYPNAAQPPNANPGVS